MLFDRRQAGVLLDEFAVVDVGVAEGQDIRVRPSDAREVDDRAVLAAPHGARLGVDGAVGAQDVDGGGSCRHRHRDTIDEVRGR